MHADSCHIKISIIVPVYNSEKFLKKNIESILAQTYKNLEILLIDDGSTDSSPTIIDEYCNNYENIRVIHKKNEGLSKTRNLGISESTGDYILHIDSDDWIEPDMCACLAEAVEKTGADLITMDIFVETKLGCKIKRETLGKHCLTSEEYLHDYSLYSNSNAIWNKLIKKNLYIENEIKHYEDISLGEDQMALLCLLINAKKIFYLNKAFYHYNLLSDGMTRNVNKPIWQYMVGLNHVRQYYLDRGKTIIENYFPYLKFRLLYTLLLHCSYKDAKKNDYIDYVKAWHSFYNDINKIIEGIGFKELCWKYKLFIWYNLLYFKLSKLFKKYP